MNSSAGCRVSATSDSAMVRASLNPWTVKFGASLHGVYSPDSLGDYISPISSSLLCSIEHQKTNQQYKSYNITLMTPRSLIEIPGRAYSMPQGTDTIMTPRSLIRIPGRVYSIPQGMDNVFVKVACLLMWMASASNKVEHKGSTMYNIPGILVQSGEFSIHVLPRAHNLPIQPANSPDMKVCNLLLLVRQHTCKLGS